jgi:hypothetical protein
VTNSEKILGVAHEFYGRLYDIKPANEALMATILDGLDRVAESEKPNLSAEELTWAVRSLNKHKASGLDGIPGEFYQTFCDLLNDDVAQDFRAIYRKITLVST